MHYLAHTQSCTSVEQAIKCDFRESGVDVLVLGKETALEFHALEPTGLKLLHKETIYGQILDLKAWKQPGADTSVIAVLTAFPHLFVLSTGGTSSFLRTVSSVSLVERSGRLSDEITCLSVDTSSRCLLAHVYAGLVRVFPLGKEVKKKGRRSSTMKKEKEMGDEKFVLEEEVDLERGYNVVLSDLNVFAISLLALPSSYPPTIGLIQQDYTGQRVFKTYALDLSNKEFFADDQLLTRKSVRLEDYGSNTIISVKSSASVEDMEEKEEGVVIVGETMAVWISLLVPEGERKSEVTSTKRKRRDTFERTIGTKLPISVITANCQVEGNSNQFVLGDLYGTFYTLNIEKSTDNREKVLSLEIENLGLTSSAKCIVYLANNYLFVGSHFSDSQLVRLPVKPSAIDAMDVDDGSGSGPVAVGNKGKGKASDKLEVIANFTNLGPIYDFRVVDVEGVGHSHVVTCSGGFGQGSLRIVRQGVGLNELASFDFESVQKCWSFRSNKAGKADHLLLSSTHDSRILAFESSEGEEAEESSVEELESFANFKFDAPTLAILQLDSGTVVQVLREEIVFGWQGRVDGVKGFRGGSNWKHPDGKKITVAAAEGDYLALGFEGGEIVLLQGTDPDQSKDLELIKSMDMSNELACLALSTIRGKTVLAAGLWNVHSVCLLSLPDLSLLHEQAIETSFPLRSVELSTFEDSSYLLVGTGEGTLIHYQFDENNTPIANTGKQIRLGTQAITFTSFESHEGSAVFVTCDQPAIISRGVDRFNYTVVGMKNVVSVATFDNVNYPSCLAFVTSDGVRIGKFDQLEKLHVRTVSLGEHEPKYLTYSPTLTAYVVICYRTRLDRESGDEIRTSSIRLIDAITLEEKWSHDLDVDELGRSIELTRNSIGEEVVVVGTQMNCSMAGEGKAGRIRGFTVTEERTLVPMESVKVNGAVFALAALRDGYFAAGVNSRVVIFSTKGSAIPEKVSSWGGAILCICLSSLPDSNSVLVGDAFRSLILLDFNPETKKLKEVARDVQCNMTTSADMLNEDTFVGTEADLNIFTIQKPEMKEGKNELMDDNLMPRGAYHLGEMVNRIRKGTMVPQFGDRSKYNSLLYATSVGSIGVIVDLDEEASRILSTLERNMQNVLPTTGNLSVKEFRTFRQDARTLEPIGFIDGDLVERFTQLSEEDVRKVMEGATEHERLLESKEEIMTLIEEMIRLH